MEMCGEDDGEDAQRDVNCNSRRLQRYRGTDDTGEDLQPAAALHEWYDMSRVTACRLTPRVVKGRHDMCRGDLHIILAMSEWLLPLAGVGVTRL